MFLLKTKIYLEGISLYNDIIHVMGDISGLDWSHTHCLKYSKLIQNKTNYAEPLHKIGVFDKIQNVKPSSG